MRGTAGFAGSAFAMPGPGRCLAAILTVFVAQACLASEGRIEINQASALAGGVTPADQPGFPVTLSTTGSYVLTSDLEPGASAPAIELQQTFTALDLNGFSLRGPLFGGVPASGIVSLASNAFNSRIHNGTVQGFTGLGIDFGVVSGVRLSDLLVYDNDLGGISLGEGGLVSRVRVSQNDLFGMSLGETTAFELCSVTETVQGQGVIGGRQLGGSYCDDGSCTRYPPMRSYYLSPVTWTAGQAPDACDDGFHMASIWEIRNTTLLRYDTTRGFTNADSGFGPPALAPNQSGSFIVALGWVRTGELSLSSGNCDAYTTSSGSASGAAVHLDRNWSDFPNFISTWRSSVFDECSQFYGAWCVQD